MRLAGDFIDDRLDVRFRLRAELKKGPPRSAVGRNGRIAHPCATGVAGEIVAGLHRTIHAREVETPGSDARCAHGGSQQNARDQRRQCFGPDPTGGKLHGQALLPAWATKGRCMCARFGLTRNAAARRAKDRSLRDTRLRQRHGVTAAGNAPACVTNGRRSPETTPGRFE